MNCKTILVVEDDLAVRQTIRDILEIEGYEVATACDGREGFKALHQLKPCLVLLDLMMPGTNGWQFLDMQRSDDELKATPVVVCSAYKESAKSVHANGILPKPIQLDELVNVVKSFCTSPAHNA
jgi:CheY-like chemotaxis protein